MSPPPEGVPAPRATVHGQPLLGLQRSAGNAVVSRALIQRDVTTQLRHDMRDEFGRFDYSFRWVCTAPHLNGHIVQRIDRDETVGTETVRTRYWEAWKVENGRVLGPDGTELTQGAHDSWVNQAEHYGTSGSWSMSGTVYWVDGALPSNFATGAVQAAAGLLSTSADPGISESARLFVHHRAHAWDARTVQAAKQLLTEWSDTTTIDLDTTPGELEEDAGFSSAIAEQAVREYLAEREALRRQRTEAKE